MLAGQAYAIHREYRIIQERIAEHECYESLPEDLKSKLPQLENSLTSYLLVVNEFFFQSFWLTIFLLGAFVATALYSFLKSRSLRIRTKNR